MIAIFEASYIRKAAFCSEIQYFLKDSTSLLKALFQRALLTEIDNRNKTHVDI